MKTISKTKHVLCGLLSGLFALAIGGSAFALPINVTYTVTGSPGNYNLNFTLQNNMTAWPRQDFYYFGVELGGAVKLGTPAGWDNPINPAFVPVNWDWFLGPGNPTYNMVWRDSAYDSLMPGNSQSGFTVRVTAATPPTSVKWFGGTYDRTGVNPYTGNEAFYPGPGGGLDNAFAGIATEATPTAPPGYTVSNYKTGLAGPLSGLAIDTATRTIYYAVQSGNSPLSKIAPNGTVSTVTANIAPSGFYPYAATDLEYSAGAVYWVSNVVRKVDVTTGIVTSLAPTTGVGNESGCVIRNGLLLYSDGNGPANAIKILNLTTLVETTVATGIPSLSSTLEYNAVRDAYYFTDVAGGRLMKMTPAGVVTQVATGLGGGTYNFAIEPSGAAAYSRTQGTMVVRRIDLTTGVVTNFVTGLSTASTQDLVVGPSSTGPTWSLYLGDGTRIVEVSGLAPDNQPPTVSSPDPVTIACTSADGATQTVSFPVTDANNDALTVQWTVDSVPLLPAVTLPAGTTLSTNAILLDYEFGFGEHTVSVSVTDGKSAPVTGSTKVTVAAHDAPEPQLATLPDLTGECEVIITSAPLANDPCAEGGVVSGVSSLGPLPLNFTAQGTYTVTWTYTSPHDGMLSTSQNQTVIVKDITPPTVTCPPDVSVAFGAAPAAATTTAEFLAQGGTIEDNCDPNGTVTSHDYVAGFCPTVITRTYVVTDAAGNGSIPCEQIITVNNLFAEDGILWLQPLARNGASSDTDPGAGGTLKYRFKLGSTIPIKVQAQGCDGNVSANANVTGTVVVFGDTDMDGVVDATETPIYYNGVGEANGVMDKVDGKLQFNLDTKKLIQTFKCYILQVTVTDSSTGESRVETLALQVK